MLYGVWGLDTELHQLLVEYRTWWLQHLQTDKEELALAIETAIQEATNCLDQGTEPGSALGRAMWTLPIEKLQVFTYTVSTPDMPTLCSNWASYYNHLKEVCQLAEAEARSVQQVSAVLPPPQTPPC